MKIEKEEFKFLFWLWKCLAILAIPSCIFFPQKIVQEKYSDWVSIGLLLFLGQVNSIIFDFYKNKYEKDPDFELRTWRKGRGLNQVVVVISIFILLYLIFSK